MYAGNQLARIHIGKKALALSDDDYRAMLFALTGKNSAKDCNTAQRASILAYMTKQGAFKTARKPLTQKQKACVAKWYALRRTGAVRSKDKSSLNRYIKHYLGGWNVADLSDAQTQKLYAMLDNWLKSVEEVR